MNAKVNPLMAATDLAFERLFNPVKRVSDAERTFNSLSEERQRFFADAYIERQDDRDGYVMDALTDVKPDHLRAAFQKGDYTEMGRMVAREFMKYGIKYFEIEEER